MGTRSLTTVQSRWDNDSEWNHNATIYRHWDGYPSVQGRFLLDALRGVHLVNGISTNTPKSYANGPGRLAAYLVCAMQENNAEPSLEPEGSVMGQEYHYVVNVTYGGCGSDGACDYDPIEVVVYDGPMTAFGAGGDVCDNEVFRGNLDEFEAFLEKGDE